MRLLAAVAAACALALAPAAHAEIWGFVDAQGTAHFAAEKLDARYELFFRGGESFDTAEGVAAPQAEPPAAAPAPAAARVLSFLQVSPGFRLVQPQVREAAREHGIELALLQALIATESGFDPGAVSPKGAIGLMQVMPATAERYGVSGDARAPVERKLKDPRTNLRAGARYLRDLLRMFPGRLELALAAYNAGEGAVQKAGNRIPNYPETKNYVRTVMQLYAMLQPEPPAAATPQAPRRVRMELPGPGGADARRNMPPGLAAVTPLEGPGAPAVVVHD
ncbi:MAG TPA: lytic transglycosylase domain-containing protein [Ramlibacter sp.]|uniref:lytic transglycosylase domain-containing protein n=1 Tax=Ramlibacter sp. TaxID=1917967 RepID=UPI002D7EFC6E|nr:lytic transglycosylase domain-containing protein [Ramlibacter sp.]HET8748814.1 lytic transglycosylase domain-containing protein [Ramlibacter sp.]